MLRKKSGSLEWLEFELLSAFPQVKHAVFLRHGGVGESKYSSLNTSFTVGDQHHHVLKNKQIVENFFNEGNSRHYAKWGRGIHGDQLLHIEDNSPEEILGYDGLMTQKPGLSLFMTHADCQIALMYDPVRQAIANIHSGWRGNVQNIFEKTVRRMGAIYGTQPEDLIVCIGPSLGPQASEFVHYRQEFPESFWAFQFVPNHFDLWALSQHQLEEAGVRPKHIQIAKICTKSNPHDYFSYRRDPSCGRHATAILLA